MTALDLTPHLTVDALIVLGIFLLIAVGIATAMAYADHVATEWQAARYEAGQSPDEGDLRPRIPEQRQPGDGS